jgi:DNA-binding PadR family transcriptional regulator
VTEWNALPYIEAVERAPFLPIGTLYASIYEDLQAHGWVTRGLGGYAITVKGLELLAKLRAEKQKETKP